MTATEYKVPRYVRDNAQTRAMARRPLPCCLCGSYPSVLYACGRRCSSCAEQAGLVAVDSGPASRELP